MQYYQIRFKNLLPVIKNELPEQFVKQTLMILRQHPKFKSVEHLNHLNLVCLEQGIFFDPVSLPYMGKSGKKTIALISAVANFSISFRHNLYFGRIQNNTLYLASNELELYDLCASPKITQFSDDEKAVWQWLESSQTNMASLSLCQIFFSHLPHPKLSQIHQLFLPENIHDCRRIQLLLNLCDTMKQQLMVKCSDSGQWHDLLKKHTITQNFSNTRWDKWGEIFQKWTLFEQLLENTDRHKKNQTEKLLKACLEFSLNKNSN